MCLWEGEQPWRKNSVNFGLNLSSLYFTSSREKISLLYIYLTAGNSTEQALIHRTMFTSDWTYTISHMVKGFSPDSSSCSKGYSFHFSSVKDLTILNMFNTFLKFYLLPCCLPQLSLACLFVVKQFCVRINFDIFVGYLPLSRRKA